MSGKEITILVMNGAMLVGLCVLFGMGKLDQTQFIAGLALLGMPSAASVLIAKKDDAPPSP